MRTNFALSVDRGQFPVTESLKLPPMFARERDQMESFIKRQNSRLLQEALIRTIGRATGPVTSVVEKAFADA
jgi:hypothetical protein